MSKETKIKGMVSILHAGGVAFRVWAPYADDQYLCFLSTQNSKFKRIDPYAQKRSILAAAMVLLAVYAGNLHKYFI